MNEFYSGPEASVEPPETKERLRCDRCGDSICDGDEFAEVSGEIICEDCLGNMKVNEWLSMLGTYLKTAEET